MNNSKVTVIVPVYMGEQWLARCIESIRKQTYTNLEIILVDDGSPDESGHICDQYIEKDNRIKVIHKENGGLSDARNAGLDIATGDFIMYVDEDDYMHPQMVEIMLDTITKSMSDIAVCDFTVIPDEMVEHFEKIDRVGEPICFTNQDIMNQLYYRNLQTVVAWDKIYRKSIFDNTRYIKGRMEDDESAIHLILHACKKIAFINEKLYFYVQRPGSITKTMSLKFYQQEWENYVNRVQFLHEKNYFEMETWTKIQMLHRAISYYKILIKMKDSESLFSDIQKDFHTYLKETEVQEKLTKNQEYLFNIFANNPKKYFKYVSKQKKVEKIKNLVKKILFHSVCS